MVEERTEVYAQVVKTPYRVIQGLQDLGTMTPQTVTVTLKVSRNIPLTELKDSVDRYELATGDGRFVRYYLFDTQSTATDWLLTLVSLPDYNQDSGQSLKPNVARVF